MSNENEDNLLSFLEGVLCPQQEDPPAIGGSVRRKDPVKKVVSLEMAAKAGLDV